MGDFRTTTGQDLPLTAADKKRRNRRLFWQIAVIVIGVIAAGCFIKIDRYTLANGYVTTEHYAEVRPPVTGIVSKILVSGGETVEAGQILVQFNSEEEEALLAETKARVSKLQTEMERRQAEMDIDLERRTLDLAEQKRTHADEVSIAELQLKNATTKLNLTRELVEKGLKAASYLEDDELKEELAKVALKSLQNKDFKIYEELLKRDREKYSREIEALKNELNAMNDSVRRVEARLQTRIVRAPIAGQVVRYEFVVGELLQPSSVIYEIFGGEKQVLKLRVSEKHATKVHTGQRYRARLTSFHDLLRIYFRGEVQALRNVIQSEGSSTYRVAYCSFDAGDYSIPPGTTAEARIYYGRSSLWFYLFNLDL